MRSGIISIVYNGDVVRSVDLEIPFSITISKCIEMLKQAQWIPETETFMYEMSNCGDEWEKLDANVVLDDVLQGDGALLRLNPIRKS